MGPYLSKSKETGLLTTIGIYSLRGDCSRQLRLLYMNAVASRVCKEMGKALNFIGVQNRPPHSALLTFGVSFSE